MPRFFIDAGRTARAVWLAWVVAAAGAGAQAVGVDAGQFDELPPDEAAVERLLSERGEAREFEKAEAAARKFGVAEQVLLEARFLYHVDRREDAELAALAPRFVGRRDSFRLEESVIFALREDWLAVVEYVQAIAALERGEKDAFKRHITEAFWLSPGQGVAFAPHIERLRMDEAMAKIRIDFGTKLRKLTGDGEVELAAMLRDRKAVALHFWSPWSRECEEFAADFAATAKVLEAHGIVVVSILAEDDPRVLEDAREFVAASGSGVPGQWLRDRSADSLHGLLRVQSVPVLVVVSADGKVMFNGHPADEECWRALQLVAPELKRPVLDTTQEK